jgi:hemerythrin-like domain-containing protein
MPIQIGAKPEANFADPIGLMTDCHRRIERFLEILVRISDEYQGQALAAQEQLALQTALNYFRDSAPKHTADEEDSLFPRLRSEVELKPCPVPTAFALREVIQRMERLENEHLMADRMHADADLLGRKWLDNGKLSRKDSARFSKVLSGLQELYQGHIALEEAYVFPAAVRMLSYGARKAIGEEMAKRRGVQVVTKL